MMVLFLRLLIVLHIGSRICLLSDLCLGIGIFFWTPKPAVFLRNFTIVRMKIRRGIQCQCHPTDRRMDLTDRSILVLFTHSTQILNPPKVPDANPTVCYRTFFHLPTLGRGLNRQEHHPRLGKTNLEPCMVQDLVLMKKIALMLSETAITLNINDGCIRGKDPSRFIHYEGGGARTSSTDIVCPMYICMSDMVKIAKDPAELGPLILCEYSHSMGNSTGNIHEYWEAIDSTFGLQGGFIWDWVDQVSMHLTIYEPYDRQAKRDYRKVLKLLKMHMTFNKKYGAVLLSLWKNEIVQILRGILELTESKGCINSMHSCCF